MSNARFSIMQATAVKDKRISDSQFRTLAALGMYADQDGWCFPSLSTLGDDLGKSKQAVGRDTIALRELGYLEVRHRYDKKTKGRHSNLYRLRFDLPSFSQRDVDGVSTSDVDGVSTSDVDVNDPINTPVNNEKQKIQKVIKQADKTMDLFLGFEKLAQGKEYSQLPDMFQPYAKAFCEATTLKYSKKFANDWMLTISEWINGGYSPEMITEAVKSICNDPRPTPISRPGSIDWKLRDMKVKRANQRPAANYIPDVSTLPQVDSSQFVPAPPRIRAAVAVQ